MHRSRDYRISIERAREHGRFQPAPPYWSAQLMGDDPMLQLTNAAAELDQFGPEALIVRLSDIAGDQMIGQTQRGRDREQRTVLERLIATADIGGAR